MSLFHTPWQGRTLGLFCMDSEGGKIFLDDAVKKKQTKKQCFTCKKKVSSSSLRVVQGCNFSLVHTTEEIKDLHLMEECFARLSVILSADIMMLVRIGFWKNSYRQDRSLVVEQRSWGWPALSPLWNNWLVSLQPSQVLPLFYSGSCYPFIGPWCFLWLSQWHRCVSWQMRIDNAAFYMYEQFLEESKTFW